MAALDSEEPMEVDAYDRDALLCTPEEAFKVLTDLGLRCNLRVFGSQMGLKTHDMDVMMHMYHSYEHRLYMILHSCCKYEELTWMKVVSVLRKPALKECRIADSICEIFKDYFSNIESDAVPLSRSESQTSLSSLEFEEELGIPGLVNEMAETKDWKSLAFSFGLDEADVEMITHHPQEEHHQRLAEMIYQRDCGVTKQKLQRLNSQRSLLAAVKEGNMAEVQSLLKDPLTRTIINDQDWKGWTALHLAATEGHVEVAELLLKNGCNVNQLAGEGWTPLQRVCLYKERHIARRGEMVNLLLDHDARLNIEDNSGRNPLFAASTSGFVDIVKILLERIAKLPPRIQRRMLNNPMANGWVPIMDAAMHGHAEVVKLLLEAGATAIMTKEDDETALHIAAYHGHVDVVKVLTASKDRFLINARDQYGLTPLMMAVSRNHSEVADVLLEAGADVNLQSNDKERRTALMLAARNGAFSIVKLLMKHKPDVNMYIKDSRNKTALDLASTSEVRHCLTEKPVTKQETEIGVGTDSGGEMEDDILVQTENKTALDLASTSESSGWCVLC